MLRGVDHERFRDYWARNVSTNKDVKVYIGAPGAVGAAGGGYQDIATLSKIAEATRKSYPSFGGVMLWDASQAYGKKSRSFVRGREGHVPSHTHFQPFGGDGTDHDATCCFFLV